MRPTASAATRTPSTCPGPASSPTSLAPPTRSSAPSPSTGRTSTTPSTPSAAPAADIPEAIHDRFVLTEPLDGYGVHDRRVSHCVGPVRLGDDGDEGRRDILIIGIAPCAPGL
ncbi:2OG-Fe dioxygenase family protein [Kitasatospora sp. NPDC054795]